MRINKYLRECGVASRREADLLIEAGKVEINARPATAGMQVEIGDEVKVEGRSVKPLPKKTYLIFNKPRGIVCTSQKRERNNLTDYLKTHTNLKKRVTYAGRLDKESEGLLLLTDDGDLIDALMTARNAHEKEYIVETTQDIEAWQIKTLSAGVYLKEINRTTLPCRVRRSGKNEFRIILTQGINRQIRRMCENVGLRVASLKRVRIENIELGKLPPGKIREVTHEELIELKRRISGA